MNTILQISVQLLELFNLVNERYETLRKKMSMIDLQLQDLEHEIEFSEPFSVVKGYNYAKSMKNIRQQRRIIKDEFEVVQSLKNILDNNNLLFKKIDKWLKQQNYNSNNIYLNQDFYNPKIG